MNPFESFEKAIASVDASVLQQLRNDFVPEEYFDRLAAHRAEPPSKENAFVTFEGDLLDDFHDRLCAVSGLSFVPTTVLRRTAEGYAA